MAEVIEQFGPYARVRRLGMGGMAETFLAVQRGAAGFEQRVCMKFILPGYRDNADFRRLFLREATIAASLRHSNIVGVIDVDESAGYLVLELVDGVDLRALLNEAPNHRLSGEQATFVTVELCKALAYAHGRSRRGQPDGIVHRDISPSNVLVSYSGEVKLTDFGVARAMRADAEPLSTTVKGKLCYMSPEQARGQILDGRSDLFAVGVVLYELLSGQRPFDGTSDADTLLRVTAGAHTPLIEVAPDVPGGLAMVVEKLLQREREQRYASADACIDALARFAPRATCYREIGALARAARPHQTLSDQDLLGHERTVPSEQRPNLTATVGLPDPYPRGPRTRPSSEGSVPPIEREDEAGSGTLWPGMFQGVNKGAWRMLGFSLIALFAVATAWALQLLPNRPRDDTGPITLAPPPRETPVSPIAGAPATPPPIFDPVPQQLPNPPTVPLVRVAEPTPVTPKHDTAPEKNPKARGVRSTEEAQVRVGVLPVGQVWVNGRNLGWAPVTAKLAAGRYSIAGGNESPKMSRSMILKGGDRREVVFNLNKDRRAPGAIEETTPDAADR